MTASQVIAIDGPAGAGKGAVAASLAAHLGWRNLDSGALYRAVGLEALLRRCDTDDEQSLVDMASSLDIKFASGCVTVNNEDRTQQIRDNKVSAVASRVSGIPRVRRALLDLQRGFNRPPGLVADGRDMGTVVFPEAKLKIFLTASLEERAKRRCWQLQGSQQNATVESLMEQMAERDYADAHRNVAPMVAAKDAVTIDSSFMPKDSVVNEILTLATERQMCLSRETRNGHAR